MTISATISTHPDGSLDYDWFTWTTNAAGTLRATLTTTQGGSLEIHIFTVDANNTLIEVASSTDPNIAVRTLNVALAAGQAVYVEIKGHESSPGVSDQGAYTLTTSLN